MQGSLGVPLPMVIGGIGLGRGGMWIEIVGIGWIVIGNGIVFQTKEGISPATMEVEEVAAAPPPGEEELLLGPCPSNPPRDQSVGMGVGVNVATFGGIVHINEGGMMD